MARIYGPDGTLVTDDFVIAPTRTFFTSSAGLTKGEFVVAYHSGGSIHARIFDGAGHNVGSEVVINSVRPEAGNQTLRQSRP